LLVASMRVSHEPNSDGILERLKLGQEFRLAP
jgi:hypothetical protein